MSRAQGINTDLSKVIGLSLSNGLVALSGALLCQYQGYADINMGRGAVVIGLAAVVIGEAVVKHISPTSPSGSPAYWWAPLSTIWCIRSSSSWASTPIC